MLAYGRRRSWPTQARPCAVLSFDLFVQLRTERPELALRLLESLSLGLARRLRAATDQIRALIA